MSSETFRRFVAGCRPKRNCGGHNRRKTHCPRGHEYSDDNTYVRPDGSRTCITCNRDSARECSRRRRAGGET